MADGWDKAADYIENRLSFTDAGLRVDVAPLVKPPPFGDPAAAKNPLRADLFVTQSLTFQTPPLPSIALQKGTTSVEGGLITAEMDRFLTPDARKLSPLDTGLFMHERQFAEFGERSAMTVGKTAGTHLDLSTLAGAGPSARSLQLSAAFTTHAGPWQTIAATTFAAHDARSPDATTPERRLAAGLNASVTENLTFGKHKDESLAVGAQVTKRLDGEQGSASGYARLDMRLGDQGWRSNLSSVSNAQFGTQTAAMNTSVLYDVRIKGHAFGRVGPEIGEDFKTKDTRASVRVEFSPGK